MTSSSILCISADRFFEEMQKQHMDLVAPNAIRLLNQCQPCWKPRETAETNPAYLQLIPYITVITRPFGVLTYQRKGGGEQRLEGKWSIGFGGHIELSDADVNSSLLATILKAANRELLEEVQFDDQYAGDMMGPLVKGLIYTGNQPGAGLVDQVHLGISMVFEVPDPLAATTRPEDGNPALKCQWVSNFGSDISHYELWSREVINNHKYLGGF